MSFMQEAKITGLASYLPTTAASIDTYENVYEQNRDRVYSLAFWMTDNELEAEEILGRVFLRAFSMTDAPSDEMIDRALITELRDLTAIGVLTLECATVNEVLEVRRNTKRIHLERALVQLPATERLIYCMHDGEGYTHARIARTLGLTEEQSKTGLYQARLRIRELVASMR